MQLPRRWKLYINVDAGRVELKRKANKRMVWGRLACHISYLLFRPTFAISSLLAFSIMFELLPASC